jgi:hypothetical protein
LKTWWPKKCCHNIKGQQYNMNIYEHSGAKASCHILCNTYEKKVENEREREIDWKRSQSYDKLLWEQKEIFRHCCAELFLSLSWFSFSALNLPPHDDVFTRHTIRSFITILPIWPSSVCVALKKSLGACLMKDLNKTIYCHQNHSHSPSN